MMYTVAWFKRTRYRQTPRRLGWGLSFTHAYAICTRIYPIIGSKSPMLRACVLKGSGHRRAAWSLVNASPTEPRLEGISEAAKTFILILTRLMVAVVPPHFAPSFMDSPFWIGTLGIGTRCWAGDGGAPLQRSFKNRGIL